MDHLTSQVPRGASNKKYYIRGVNIENFTTGNALARRVIRQVKTYYSQNLQDRMASQTLWRAFGLLFQFENWPKEFSEIAVRNMMSTPVPGNEDALFSGAASYV